MQFWQVGNPDPDHTPRPHAEHVAQFAPFVLVPGGQLLHDDSEFAAPQHPPDSVRPALQQQQSATQPYFPLLQVLKRQT